MSLEDDHIPGTVPFLGRYISVFPTKLHDPKNVVLVVALVRGGGTLRPDCDFISRKTPVVSVVDRFFRDAPISYATSGHNELIESGLFPLE